MMQEIKTEKGEVIMANERENERQNQKQNQQNQQNDKQRQGGQNERE